MKRFAVIWISMLCLTHVHAFVIKKESTKRSNTQPHGHVIRKRALSLADIAQLYRENPNLFRTSDSYGEQDDDWGGLLGANDPPRYGEQDSPWPYEHGDTGYNPGLGGGGGGEGLNRAQISEALERVLGGDTNEDDIVPMSSQDVNELLAGSDDEDDELQQQDANLDKKNVDWMPKAQGGVDITKGTAEKRAHSDEDEEEVGADEGVAEGVVKADGNVVHLSSQQVQKLLSEPSEVEVNGVHETFHVENINGHQQGEAKTVYDITSKDDNSEHTLEVDEPVSADELAEAAEDLDDEMDQTQSELNEKEQLIESLLGRTGLQLSDFPHRSVKRKRSQPDELYPEMSDRDQVDEIDPEELAKKCLMRYIELEDSENRELAAAINWATMDQVSRDESEARVGSEVNHLKSAIGVELQIQQLQSECADILRKMFPNSQLLEDDEEETPEEEKRTGGMWAPPDNAIDDELVDDVHEGKDEEEEEQQDEETPYGGEEWGGEGFLEPGGGVVQDDDDDDLEPYAASPDTSQEEGEWYLNPFYRDLMYKLASEDEPSRSSLVRPEIPDECPMLEILTDGCATLTSSNVYMDDEALLMCSKHQLCYTCGAALDIPEESCDVLYFQQAHNLCGPGDPECRETSRHLFNLMQDTHTYRYPSPPGCTSRCVLDAFTEGA